MNTGFISASTVVSESIVDSCSRGDSVIRFSVTSQGMTGIGWFDYLKEQGKVITPYTEKVLLSTDFKPTKDVTTHVRVLRDSDFTTPSISQIRTAANNWGLLSRLWK